jgi:hypothetical protein
MKDGVERCVLQPVGQSDDARRWLAGLLDLARAEEA